MMMMGLDQASAEVIHLAMKCRLREVYSVTTMELSQLAFQPLDQPSCQSSNHSIDSVVDHMSVKLWGITHFQPIAFGG